MSAAAGHTSALRRRRRVWRVIGVTLVALAVVAAVATPLVLSLPPFGGELSGERLARARANPHHRDGRFVNPLPPAEYTWGYAWTLLKGTFFGDEVRVP